MNKYFYDRLPLFVFVIIIFVSGISFGAIAVKTVDYSIRENVFAYFNDFMKGYDELNYSNSTLVSESIKFNLLNIVIIWVLGISVFLMPLITVLVFFKGFVLGFTVGFLVNEYSLQGVIMAIAAVFPQNLIIIPAYILAAVMAIYLSVRIFKYYRGLEGLNGEDLLTYTLEMGLLALLLVGGSIIETFISPYLMKIILHFI
ncbi:MAG: stage II sporulation protein M [Firmicutes bacterium]|nr:stage II sporulation protein M [Bacillota bacterium]